MWGSNRSGIILETNDFIITNDNDEGDNVRGHNGHFDIFNATILNRDEGLISAILITGTYMTKLSSDSVSVSVIPKCDNLEQLNKVIESARCRLNGVEWFMNSSSEMGINHLRFLEKANILFDFQAYETIKPIAFGGGYGFDGSQSAAKATICRLYGANVISNPTRIISENIINLAIPEFIQMPKDEQKEFLRPFAADLALEQPSQPGNPSRNASPFPQA